MIFVCLCVVVVVFNQSLFLFISFCSLTVVASTSKSMLNSCGQSQPSFLVPDFRENAFGFSPLRTTLSVGLPYLSCGLYYVEIRFLYASFLKFAS